MSICAYVHFSVRSVRPLDWKVYCSAIVGRVESIPFFLKELGNQGGKGPRCPTNPAKKLMTEMPPIFLKQKERKDLDVAKALFDKLIPPNLKSCCLDSSTTCRPSPLDDDEIFCPLNNGRPNLFSRFLLLTIGSIVDATHIVNSAWSGLLNFDANAIQLPYRTYTYDKYLNEELMASESLIYGRKTCIPCNLI